MVRTHAILKGISPCSSSPVKGLHSMDGNWQEVVSGIALAVAGAVAAHLRASSAHRKNSSLENTPVTATVDMDNLDTRLVLTRIEEHVVATHKEVTGIRLRLEEHDRRITSLENAAANKPSIPPFRN